MKKITQMITRSTRESKKAIQQFLSTEDSLKQENEEINKAMILLEEEAIKLENLRAEGDVLYRENEGIINRISEFVRGTDINEGANN